MSLDDCGKIIAVRVDRVSGDGFATHYQNVEVSMVIKAPRGILIIYDRPEKSPWDRSADQEKQAQAIHEFMEFDNA